MTVNHRLSRTDTQRNTDNTGHNSYHNDKTESTQRVWTSVNDYDLFHNVKLLHNIMIRRITKAIVTKVLTLID